MTQQQTEQYFVDNPDKLRESIILLIEGISSSWMSFEQNDPRPRILLRYLYLYFDYASKNRKTDAFSFNEDWDFLFSEISMYIAGFQNTVIHIPSFLKD